MYTSTTALLAVASALAPALAFPVPQAVFHARRAATAPSTSSANGSGAINWDNVAYTTGEVASDVAPFIFFRETASDSGSGAFSVDDAAHAAGEAVGDVLPFVLRRQLASSYTGSSTSSSTSTLTPTSESGSGAISADDVAYYAGEAAGDVLPFLFRRQISSSTSTLTPTSESGSGAINADDVAYYAGEAAGDVLPFLFRRQISGSYTGGSTGTSTLTPTSESGSGAYSWEDFEEDVKDVVDELVRRESDATYSGDSGSGVPFGGFGSTLETSGMSDAFRRDAFSLEDVIVARALGLF